MKRILFVTIFLLSVALLPCVMQAQYVKPPTGGGPGGNGTVTQVTSADANATVANQTTTPVITIVNAPTADSLLGHWVVVRGDSATLFATLTALAGKQAAGTYLVPADSTKTHNWVNANFQPVGVYLVPADSTKTHNFVVAYAQPVGTYLVPSDSTKTHNFVVAYAQPLGNYLAATDSIDMAFRTWVNNRINALKDTLPRGFSSSNIATIDSGTICRIEESGLTVRAIRVRSIGGTNVSVNVTRLRSGTNVDMLSGNYSPGGAGWTDDFETCTGLQNTSLQIGDVLKASIRGVTGTIQECYVEVLCDKQQK